MKIRVDKEEYEHLLEKVKILEEDGDVLCDRIDYMENWLYLLFEHLDLEVKEREWTKDNPHSWELVKKH